MRVRWENQNRRLDLEASPLAQGGEAAIYLVQGQPELVAKIYHEPSDEQGAKLAAMLAAPPPTRAADGHTAIAWPLGRLLAADAERVVGYVMPRVADAKTICDIYNPAARRRKCPLFHYGYLVRTARNLAAAVRSVHDAGYVIGDLNEANVLVTNQALVTLVDTDSYQVHAPERVFRCRVGRPEYTPPELQGVFFADQYRQPEHDGFALGVLIFQLLMQGVHPFAGLYTGGQEPPSLPERIAAGHWPYSFERAGPLQPSPNAPPWTILPAGIQDLLWRCFDEGHASLFSRPGARDWQQALEDAERQLTTCTLNEQHRYAAGLDVCPWCLLDQQHDNDPFPSREELKRRQARARALQAAAQSPRTGQVGVAATAVLMPLREDPDPPAPHSQAPTLSWLDQAVIRLGSAIEGQSLSTWIAVAALAALAGVVWTLQQHLPFQP